MITRRHKLSRDPKGYYRPYIGWTVTPAELIQGDESNRKQVRFNLGRDQREAELRYSRIQKLYEENVQAGGLNLWTGTALEMAKDIASGKPVEFHKQPSESPAEYAQSIQLAQQHFPSVPIIPADQAAYVQSVQLNSQMIGQRLQALEAELRELGALIGNKKLPDKIITGTFHEALSSYEQMIERDGDRLSDGVLKLHQRKRLAYCKNIRFHHQDFPLYELNANKCKEMLAYWRNRPAGQKVKQMKASTAEHNIKELMQFFKWLDEAETFEWQMPKGVLGAKRKITPLAEDRKTSIVSKDVYSPDELATLAKYATDWERLALFVGLNCAMGAAELGRLKIDEILLHHEHEYARRLHFTSTKEDSFIRALRPKTNVFGEWILWPETVQVLEWAIARATKLGSDLIFVRQSGNPLYNDSSSNPQAAFQNMWNKLLDRTCKNEKNFRRLPFGTLRDTLPDVIRHSHTAELAQLAVAHGAPHKGDSLLECYSNKPYGRLHEAIREHHETFKDVLISIR